MVGSLRFDIRHLYMVELSTKKPPLRAVWQRFATRVALGVTLMTTACTPTRKTGDVEPDNRPNVADTTSPSGTDAASPALAPLEIDLEEQVILTSKEEARREAIKAKLISAAKKDYLKLAGLSSGEGYSQQLTAMQQSLSANLAVNGGKVHSRAVMLDPEKFEIGLALGLTTQAAIRKMLTEQNVKPDAALLAGVVDKLGTTSESRFGGRAIAANPAAITNLTKLEATVCVIVPSSEHALVIDIRGLSPSEQVNFANKHEGWHCLDTKYTLHNLDPKQLAHPPKGSLSQNVGNKTVLEVHANGYRKEALADVGAIGDMIRHEGYGLDLIGKISDWRQRSPGEIDHLSSPVLKGFRERIEQMGLEAFRKLDDEQAKALYFEVTDKFGMSARSIEINLRLEKMNVAGRLAFVEANSKDPELPKALDFMGYYYNKVPDRGVVTLTETEKQLAGQLRAWDAEKLLADKAFTLGGKVTPATLIQAYGALQDGLHADRLSKPGDALLSAEMTKLQQTFVFLVQDIDYVEANQKRSVDITKAEPVLLAKAQKGGHKL